MAADVVTEFIEGLVETYPGLQYLDGFPQVIYFLDFDSLPFNITILLYMSLPLSGGISLLVLR